MKKLILLIAIAAFTVSAAAQIKVLTNGNVGIGVNNTNPSYKLDVIGPVKFSRPNWGYDHIYFEWASTSGYPRIYSPSCLWLGLDNYPLWTIYVTYHYAKNSYNWSDERLKENILPLGSTLDKLLQIEGKRFNFKKEEFGEAPEVLPSETFGLIAQELMKVFPELVSSPSSENGYYAVNYNGMIPVLLEAIKEQQTQIEKLQFMILKQANEMELLQEHLEACQNNPDHSLPQNMPAGENFKQNKEGKLFQNTPNPFNASTEIKFEIPVNSTSARLLIHDMQGAEIKSYSITSKGIGNIIIQGAELQAGMYMYTLLVNNTIVDSKRMILTK